LHIQELDYKEGVYELGDHVEEKALYLNLSPKFGFAKKTSFASFSNLLLKNIWIKSIFPYAPLPHHEGAKQNNIRVIRGGNANLPHHKSFMLTYPMKNGTPLVHHVIKWQGCGYIIKDNESLNERTLRHPKMKSKSELM
jgi:hypothetical protein